MLDIFEQEDPSTASGWTSVYCPVMKRQPSKSGPEASTHEEMASQLSETLGKEVAFVDIPEREMRDALVGFGLPEWQADSLMEDYAQYRRGEASTVSTVVRDATGHPPRSFAAFASDYKQAFLQ